MLLLFATKVTFLNSIFFIHEFLLNIAGYCCYYELNVDFLNFAVISVLKWSIKCHIRSKTLFKRYVRGAGCIY